MGLMHSGGNAELSLKYYAYENMKKQHGSATSVSGSQPWEKQTTIHMGRVFLLIIYCYYHAE